MKNVFFVLTFMFFVNFAYSQQSVVVAGGSQSGVTGEFSYTIGMPIYGMSENEGKAFTIGVQQVFDAIEVMDVALDNVENNGENIMMNVVQVSVLLMLQVVVRLHFAVAQKLLKTKKQVVSRLLLLSFHIR